MSTTNPESLSLDAARQASACACFNLRKATRLVTQLYDDAMRPAGIRVTQFTLLAALRQLAPVPVSELADALATDRTTLTRNLKLLEKDGLIESHPGTDRRIRELTLTDEGHRVLKKAFPLWQEAQATMGRSLGDERLDHLVTELSAAVAAVRKTH